MISLGLNDQAFSEKEKLYPYQVVQQVRTLTDSEEIAEVYKQFGSSGTVLIEVAENSFTPKEILRELMSVRGIPYAGEIRRISRMTLKKLP